jgi:3-deoxy-D-manno-octulosonate 8-phosphate phosphatase (KDO 8-P phosphatase)
LPQEQLPHSTNLPTVLVDAIRRLRFLAFDFDGVFTDNHVYILEDGRESVRCSRSDGIGLSRLRELGMEMIIISTEVNQVVQTRAAKLKLPCINGCEDKISTLIGLLADRGLDLEQVAFMGNDVNDRDCLKQAGLPVVVADAHPDVIELGLYRTRLRGGYGAVREFCDLVATEIEGNGKKL